MNKDESIRLSFLRRHLEFMQAALVRERKLVNEPGSQYTIEEKRNIALASTSIEDACLRFAVYEGLRRDNTTAIIRIKLGEEY